MRPQNSWKRTFLVNLRILSRTKQTEKKGCVIFDDLMSELSECGLLLDLFSKYSSHYDLTTIHITQNIFFKAEEKHGSDHVTIYQNMHVLVLFKNPLDNTVIHTITQCISRGKKIRWIGWHAASCARSSQVHSYNGRFKNFSQIEISYWYFCYRSQTSPDISFGKINSSWEIVLSTCHVSSKCSNFFYIHHGKICKK